MRKVGLGLLESLESTVGIIQKASNVPSKFVGPLHIS